MGVIACSATAVTDVPGDHHATCAEVTRIVDRDIPLNVSRPSVIPLGEATACTTESDVTITAATTTELETAIDTEVDGLAHTESSGATSGPSRMHIDTSEGTVQGNAGEATSELHAICPVSGPDGHSKEASRATSPEVASAVGSTAPLGIVQENLGQVPPILTICRYLQAEKRAAKSSAALAAQQEASREASRPRPTAESIAADAFLNEMGSGAEGHQYDQAEIRRLALELAELKDPNAISTRESEPGDNAEKMPSKKKAVKKRAVSGTSETQRANTVIKKRAGQVASKSQVAKPTGKDQAVDGTVGPKRKPRMPGCSVREDLAKHMTQEELDDHEERRERWVRSEMQKIKDREHINRRMETACQQQ